MTDDFKDEIRKRANGDKGIPQRYIEQQADSLRVVDGSECVLNESGRLTATEAGIWMFDVGQYITFNGPADIPKLPQEEPNFGSLASEQRSEAKNIARRVLRDNGWTRAGSGTVREVWQPPADGIHIDDPSGCLVKIARWSERDYDAGVEQNRQEIANWMVGSDEERRVLTPPSEYNAERHRWFTVPRVDTNVSREESEQLIDNLENDGWSLLDLRRENIGKLEGRVIILDSGIVYPPDSRKLSDKVRELEAEDPGNTLHEVLEL